MQLDRITNYVNSETYIASWPFHIRDMIPQIYIFLRHMLIYKHMTSSIDLYPDN